MKKALIVVDLQKDFCVGGSLAVAETGEIYVNQVSDLIESDDYEEVALTQDWHPANHGSFAETHGAEVYSMGELGGQPQVMWPTHCVQDTDGAEFADNLSFEGKHGPVTVFYKGMDPDVDSYSGFYDNNKSNSSGLSEFLIENEITDVDVCGLATDYCVKFTALDAAAIENLNVTVLWGASRGVFMNDGDRQQTLADLEAAGVLVVGYDQA